MATYVNDLRLKEITTGDESGTWGTSTNTNLELIAEAFSYGTEVITTNADTHTTTIADGATDPGRALYLKYTGTLDSACTITIGPNTVSKVWIIENGTSGSQDIILSQGSGANITIPAGDTKVVYSDGAGAGAAFVDAFASLSVVDLKVQDDLTVTGDIDVDGTTNLDIVDIDGAVDMASTLGVTGAANFSSVININSASYDNRQAGINNVGFYIYNDPDNRYDLQISDIGGFTTTPAAGGHAVFNENSVDSDFRVESDTNAHAFYVDGTNGNVGIGTNADYGDRLTVVPAATATTVADAKQIQIGESSGNTSYRMQLGYYADPVSSWQSSIQSIAGGNPAGLVLNGDGGNVGIGTTEPAAKFDVRQATINVITGRFVNNTSTNAACLKVQQDGAGSSGPALLVRQDGSGNAITVDSASDGNTVFSVSNAGALSKASGSFKINHPLEAKTDTHHLIHSFIEGPQADNIYRGKVDLVAGSATVNIDTVAGMTEGTFVALNREVQCFTTNESNWDAVKGSVSGNILTIESENSESTATISWLVIGERKDQHMYDTDWTDENGKVIVEPIKS
jgi:hypothetical protein